MTHWLRRMGVIGALALCLAGTLGTVGTVGAADAPDFTKFGYPTVAKSMDLTPDQAATITAGDQSVAIKAGTFDGPVTFDLLTSDASAWKDQVKDRTVRAAFAFRVTDKTTKAILGSFKQPVTYTYSGKDAQSSDAILNTSAATPPVITANPTPITFDGKVNHPFGGAGVGWLVVSAPTGTAAGSAAPAATGGGTATTAGATTANTPTTLPKTGVARTPGPNARTGALLGGVALLLLGVALVRPRRTGKSGTRA